jgi:hypothetical protein
MATYLRINDVEDNSRDVRVIAADLIAFELEHEIPASKIESFKHMCWLAWKAETRATKSAKTFDEWLVDVDSVTDTDDPKASSR